MLLVLDRAAQQVVVDVWVAGRGVAVSSVDQVSALEPAVDIVAAPIDGILRRVNSTERAGA